MVALCLLTAAMAASELTLLQYITASAYGSKRSATRVGMLCGPASRVRLLRGGSVTSMFTVKEDRYGGVEVGIVDDASTDCFEGELASLLAKWRSDGKGGIWLKVPRASSAVIGSAVLTHGFAFHHATPDYALLTLWLPDTPNPLPRYGFTQIGVGGVVTNERGEVLLVQERVSPSPSYQGSWKCPGGLADPGEGFADTVIREVQEETGVRTALVGLASLRHSHGKRFGQGDLYVIVRLRAEADELTIDHHELRDARWMSPETIRSLVVSSSDEPLDGKISQANWRMIEQALDGELIVGAELLNSKGEATMLYTAPKREGAPGQSV